MSQKCPSSKRKVKCRFCNEEMLEKNYNKHLHRKHKSYSGDKRSAGQTSLANFMVLPDNITEEEDVIENQIIETAKEANNTEKEDVLITQSCANEGSPKNDDPTMDEENITEYPSEIENTTVADTAEDKFSLILQHIKKLEKEVASLSHKEINPSSSTTFPKDCKNEREANDEENTISYVFQSCRSISDITSFFDEFEFDEVLSTIVCRTCVPVGNSLPEKTSLNNHPALFVYNTENGLDFPLGCNLPNAFRCLKRHLKDHLSSKIHQKAIELKADNDKVKEAQHNREREIGMRIGRIAYKLYYKGRPYSDFEEEIALSAQNGCDMGDINHSEAFIKNFLINVSDVITNRLKNFFNERQIQTGFQPPIKIVADKATWKHRTRHFIMAVTVVPDSNKLLHAIYLGHPVIKVHSGKGVAESIISCMSEWNISKEQYIGGSFDGQYFNLNVPKYLNEYFGKENEKNFFHYDWDPMHKAGLVDDHLRKNSKFSWVTAVSQSITSIFNDFNFGKEYEHLRDVYMDGQELDKEKSKFKNPCFFSETRFANHCKKIYKNFREDFKAIITVLEERQAEAINGDYLQREKATNANIQMNKIFNSKFCLRLSGLCDVYDHFSKIISILQEVDILPHERYNSFVAKVNYLKCMSTSTDKESCPCTKTDISDDDETEDELKKVTCYWPTYHGDTKSLETVGIYQDVPLFLAEPEEVNLTRSQSKKIKIDSTSNKLLNDISSELHDIASHIAQELTSNVYSEDDLILLNDIQVLTDLKLLATKIKLKGIPFTAASVTDKFVTSAQKLVFELKDVSLTELKFQYRRFLEKIEEIIKPMPSKDFIGLNSSCLIKKILSSKAALFKDIELVLHAVTVAATIMSVESVCESLTSKYEYHNNKRRPVSEETAHHEMIISVNGPLPTKCDSVINNALNQFFVNQSDWHFLRKSHNIKEWFVSKTVDKLMSKGSSLPFME